MLLRYEKNKQAGRSMIEMLGVLAIIGILSVGAVAGFNYAMDKHRATATINDINVRAVTLDIQLGRNIPLSLQEFSPVGEAGYPIGLADQMIEEGYGITVDQVPNRVCQMLVEDLQDHVHLIRISGQVVTDKAACSQINAMTFEFSGSSAPVNGPQLCSEGQKWSMDLCAECATDSDCSGTTPYCDLGICSACNKDICSGPNQFCGSSNNSQSVANYNKCKTFRYEKIEEEYDIYRVWVDGASGAGWWDAYKVCQEMGKSLLSVTDLLDEWDGTSSWAHNPIKEFSQTDLNKKLIKPVTDYGYGAWTITPGDTTWAFLWWPTAVIDNIERTRKSMVLCR